MRDVGNEISLHRLRLLHRRHVPGQQQQTPLAIRVKLHGQLNRSEGGALPSWHDQFSRIVLTGKIAGKAGVTHQITKMLQPVPVSVQTKMCGGNLIEPLNLPL